MMDNTVKSKNQVESILEFPYEIMEEIFNYLPEKRNLSLVCKKFHEIVCNMFPCVFNLKMLKDDEDYYTVMNSKRKFSSILLKSDNYFEHETNETLTEKHSNRLMYFVEIFGVGIKSLTIKGLKLQINLTCLLRPLQNLEKLKIKTTTITPKPSEQIILAKLEQITIVNCNFRMSDVYKNAKDDVLKELKLDLDYEEVINDWLNSIFTNQRNLRIVKIHYENPEPGHFKWIKIPDLKNLEKLQSLSIYEGAVENLDELSSETLKFLRTEIIKGNHVQTVAKNFPKLEVLELDDQTDINIINSIIKNIQNLKKLMFNVNKSDRYDFQENYVFQENLSNESLTTLVIGSCYFGSSVTDVPKLIGACKNLESFETSLQLGYEEVTAVLLLGPNLKSLYLKERFFSFSMEFISMIKRFGNKLNYFKCDFLFEHEYREIAERLLQHEFGDQFKQINVTYQETDDDSYLTIELKN